MVKIKAMAVRVNIWMTGNRGIIYNVIAGGDARSVGYRTYDNFEFLLPRRMRLWRIISNFESIINDLNFYLIYEIRATKLTNQKNNIKRGD